MLLKGKQTNASKNIISLEDVIIPKCNFPDFSIMVLTDNVLTVCPHSDLGCSLNSDDQSWSRCHMSSEPCRTSAKGKWVVAECVSGETKCVCVRQTICQVCMRSKNLGFHSVVPGVSRRTHNCCTEQLNFSCSPSLTVMCFHSHVCLPMWKATWAQARPIIRSDCAHS